MGVHAAVAGVFFAFGLGVGLWGGASGAILTRAGVDPAAFGVILTVYTAAYLAAMTAGGALAIVSARGGSSSSARACSAWRCAAPRSAERRGGRGLLVVSGFLGGLVDVTMNAEGRADRAPARQADPGAPARRGVGRAWRSARCSAA